MDLLGSGATDLEDDGRGGAVGTVHGSVLVPSTVERGRGGGWCHCWNASRTGHLNRSLIDACAGMTIAGSCTDQCHTESVPSWRCVGNVQREIWRRKVD